MFNSLGDRNHYECKNTQNYQNVIIHHSKTNIGENQFKIMGKLTHAERMVISASADYSL